MRSRTRVDLRDSFSRTKMPRLIGPGRVIQADMWSYSMASGTVVKWD